LLVIIYITECSSISLVCPDTSFTRSDIKSFQFFFIRFNFFLYFNNLLYFCFGIIMFKCEKCRSEFKRKDYLTRHEKTHDKVCFQCVQCTKSFNYKSNLVRHMKNIHARARCDNIMIAPQHGHIEIASQISVPDIPAGLSN